MMNENKARRLAAIMFTDIVGYTALMQRSEQQAIDLRSQHRQVFQQFHENHQGEIVQYFGDGTLSIFNSGIEAIECAIDIQLLLQQEYQIPLRIGIHVGDIVYDGIEIYGDGVNTASRIESMGEAGAILLSGKLNDEVKNHNHISTTSMGHYELKNIQEPVEIFAVSNQGIPLPTEIKKKAKQSLLKNSIAVLPFVNLSASEENEYFSDGMTEEIINALAKIKKLKVTSRTSSFFFKGKQKSIKEIGRELNVATILEGSIRLSGKMMRITAQLINVENDAHFWSETWDRELENVFDIQDEISLLIAEKLREHTGHFEIQDQLVKKQTFNIQAYECFLKGRFHYTKWNQQDVNLAIAYFEKAIDLDDQYAEAYASLAGCYIYMASTGFLPAEVTFTKAKILIERGLKLNNQSSEVYFILGGLSFWFEWDFKTAKVQIEQGIQLNPNNADARQSLGLLHLLLGQKALAIENIDMAIRLDPISPNQKIMQAWVYYMLGNYQKCIDITEQVRIQEPKSVPNHIIRGSALIMENRQQEVIDYYENSPNPAIDISTKVGMTAIAHVFNKDVINKDASLKILHEQLMSDHAERALAFIFLVHAISGEFDQAIDWLEKGIQNKSPLLLFLIDDPLLFEIKKEPRYKNLVRSVFGKRSNFNEAHQTARKKRKRPLLSAAANDAFAQRLQDVMQQDKPYLEPDLSLKKLAKLIDIHPNQLSWLLNEYFGNSFNDFINHYRSNYFKALATDPNNEHITLMGLAFQSGFNSKTVFNTYFKKENGMTPSSYLKTAEK